VNLATAAASASASVALVTALSYVSVGLLGLSVLTGILALALRAADVRKITLRVWLGFAWLATLVVPALAWGVFTGGYAILHALHDSTGAPLYTLDAPQLGALQVAVPLLTLLLTMGVVAWLTGHSVLRPLAAMRQAAHQVAAGDLEIRLPDPQLREVAAVAEAFGAMGEALRASLERQAELEQQRRLVIGAIAHDLRTPLFSLRGYLEGLERGLASTPEKAAHYLAITRQQADSLERLVADLFTFTRLDYLEETPQREPVDLAMLLGAAVESAQPRAAEKHITLVAQGPPACVLEGDPHLLTRAVENLLDNALRHTPAGGRISVYWERAAAGYRFLVADSGPGIAPTDLPHIFDPLYRGETSRNRATGGAGLGLAIAQRILHAHGGSLTAATQPGGGAVLVGTLPGSACESLAPTAERAADTMPRPA
jgi:signal transduction histidine kinase